MELKHRKLPNKINEQYLLPVLFLLVNVTVVLWFYLVHEYSRSSEVFNTQYGIDQFEIARYRSELKFQIVLYSVVILISPLWLKYRKRWLLLAITLMHVTILYDFFYLK
ncbi:MAG: hypothetical protein AAF519_06895 [Bacteroidota bacterium]